MTNFGKAIRPYVQAELQSAHEAEAQGQPEVAFSHMERAHVLGQASTTEHVRIYWRMLLWGFRQRSFRECAGQAISIAGRHGLSLDLFSTCMRTRYGAKGENNLLES